MELPESNSSSGQETSKEEDSSAPIAEGEDGELGSDSNISTIQHNNNKHAINVKWK